MIVRTSPNTAAVVSAGVAASVTLASKVELCPGNDVLLRFAGAVRRRTGSSGVASSGFDSCGGYGPDHAPGGDPARADAEPRVVVESVDRGDLEILRAALQAAPLGLRDGLLRTPEAREPHVAV